MFTGPQDSSSSHQVREAKATELEVDRDKVHTMVNRQMEESFRTQGVEADSLVAVARLTEHTLA